MTKPLPNERMEPLVGTCMKMCSDREIKMRERTGLLHMFEMEEHSRLKDNNNRDKKNGPKADVRKMIKEFTRSSAGQEAAKPDELRPAKVLLQVVEYLVNRVLPRTDVSFNIVYDYIFDRLRAVRQDMSIQCLSGPECISILEQAVRFHIYSEYRFREADNINLFSEHINDVHLRECLQSLMIRYEEIESRVKSNQSYNHNHSQQQESNILLHRPLFEAIYLMYHLGSTQGLVRYGSISLSPQLRETPIVKRTFQISVQFLRGNYYRVLQSLLSTQPLILAICASTHIPKIHHLAIHRMAHAYHSKTLKFPIETLSKWLCPFEIKNNKVDDYVRELCSHYSLNVVGHEIIFDKNSLSASAEKFPTKKWTFIDSQLSKCLNSSIVEGRRELKDLETIKL